MTDLTLPPVGCLQILTDLGADGYEAGAVGIDYGSTILIRGDKNLDYGMTKAVFATRFPFTADPHRSSLLRGALRPAAACEHIISPISLIDPTLFRLHTTDTCHNVRYSIS